MSEQPKHNWDFEPAADHGLPPIARFKSVKREPGFFTFAAHAAAAVFLRGYFKVYHRMTVEGAEHLPRKTPFVVIANHASHLDALTLAAALPLASRVNTYPVAAGDVFFETMASSILTAIIINALPLWRKKVTAHALDELRERLERGHSGYILFPEGARTRDGEPLPFKAGLGMLIAGTSVPVVPCYISGAFEALNAEQRVPRPRKIGVRVGPAMTFEKVESRREGWVAIAEAAREAVLKLRPGLTEKKA
jgi:1-acyl-sn-glycerol-3-phosphate acyltransferase